MTAVRHVFLLAAALALTPAFAQTKPAPSKPVDSMEMLRDKLKGDKKLVVTAAMELTEAEAKGFWPVYEDYQKELHKINDRLAMAVVAYAKEYKANTLTDEKAASLIEQSVAIEEDETKLKRSILPRLSKVLPGRKVARYIQLENKVRAIVKIELAKEVPLAQ